MGKDKSDEGDPVVAEVRKTREALWQRGGGTHAGLMRVLDELVPRRPRGRQTPPKPRRAGRESTL
jgi:hypothetical protein